MSRARKSLVHPLDRVKRAAASKSFLKEGKSEYVIQKNGHKIKLKAQLEEEQDGFSIYLKTPIGQEIGGVKVDTFRGQTNYHRFVEKSFRGYNLGKLLLRLTDQESARRGKKNIFLTTSQQETINTALSIGYELTTRGQMAIRILLEIPLSEKLPSKQKLIKILNEKKFIAFPMVEVERKFKPAK